MWRLGRFVMEETSSGVVRVATLNLWGRRGAWDERRPVLIDGFRRLQLDLVAFQEAVVVDGYDQVTDILGTGYHVAHQAGRETDGTGLSIASRWEVGKVWEGTLHVTPRVDPSKIAVAEILAPDSRRNALVRPPQRLVAIELRARAGATGCGRLAPRRGSAGQAGDKSCDLGRRLQRCSRLC